MKRLIIASALTLAAISSRAQHIAMKGDNGVQWSCGGVGAEERREMSALEPQANVAILLVTEKRGGYLADVDVLLFHTNTSSPRLKISADGPMCLLRVPPGRYRVEGIFRGATRRAQANVPASTVHPVRVVLAFPGEPWDGIWASPEEKQQAKE